MSEPSPSIPAEVERMFPCMSPGRKGCFDDKGPVHWKDCPANHRPAVAAALQARDDKFAHHTSAVSQFLRDMTAVYDPCADADAIIPVKDACETLLARATADRQYAYDQLSALQAKQDEIDRLDQLRIDEVSDAQSKAQDIYICAIAENRGLKERIKVLEAALKPFACEAEHWNDIRDQSAPTYPLKGASRLNVQMLRDARTALNRVPASTGEQKDKAE